ncbi:MAG: N-acetyltransferase [Acidimicrobiaceae bacterium]|nr:N-acetyltransferase [Acidimicrobiaceae bacterium]
MAASVRDNPEKSRYEIEVDGELAGFTEYHLHAGVLALTHTEVSPGFEGRGLASVLIGQALDDARKRGLAVQPFCPFVRNYVVKHADLRDLVRPEDRERFDLSDA